MGVRVNAVAPGPTETEAALDALRAQAPMGRLGTAEDVARIVRLVADPDAAWLSGQILDASGAVML